MEKATFSTGNAVVCALEKKLKKMHGQVVCFTFYNPLKPAQQMKFEVHVSKEFTHELEIETIKTLKKDHSIPALFTAIKTDLVENSVIELNI